MLRVNYTINLKSPNASNMMLFLRWNIWRHLDKFTVSFLHEKELFAVSAAHLGFLRQNLLSVHQHFYLSKDEDLLWRALL